jgi:hypothetical protein
MSVRFVKDEELPKYQRRHEWPTARIMATHDWLEAKRGLESGKNNIVWAISRAQLKQITSKTIRTAAKPLVRFVREHFPAYVVRTMNTAEGAIITIARRAEAAQKRA